MRDIPLPRVNELLDQIKVLRQLEQGKNPDDPESWFANQNSQ